MWVTSRSHYGLNAMVGLARAYGEGPVSLSQLAQTEKLPLAYLEQLVMPLRKAGLVEAKRGHGGGYQLALPPDQVTVYQVVRALDGIVAPVECVAEDYLPGTCVREAQCTSKYVWRQVQQSINQVLQSITLADLCRTPEDPSQTIGSLIWVKTI